jgi:hypothetical protein
MSWTRQFVGKFLERARFPLAGIEGWTPTGIVAVQYCGGTGSGKRVTVDNDDCCGLPEADRGLVA